AEWQVRFIGLTDGTDTADKSNKKSREINALVNQWYAEDISTKVRAAFKTKQELGCFIGSYPAYGYIKGATKGKLEIDPETAPVVRKIFALYLSGHGTHAIASLLNRAGIPNPTAKKESQYPNYKNPFKKNLHSIWNKTSIRRILRNQLYIGNMVQHKSEKLHFKTKRRKTMPPEDWDVVPDTHQPIIDSTTFNQVQAMLTARIRSTGQGLPHLFAGRVFCKDCGSGMVKSSHRSYSYLTCSRHRDGGSCTRHSIRLDTLTGVVTARLRVVLSGLMPERANLAARLAAREESSSHSRMLTTNLTNTQARIHAVLAGLKALYLEQSQVRLDRVTFEQLKGELLREKACLEAESERLNTDIADLGDPNSRQQFWADALEQLIACPSLSRELVNTMINYIEIGEKQNKCQEVVIHYNFRNG
ncbi:MAG TPA: recombinase family protein, partial [Bacillota bacterium]|nr:recombinase family protein [Bacillota bacterium]